MSSLPPVAGAKIDLLKCVEATRSCEASLLAEELLDARTLGDLARRARGIAHRLREIEGNAVATKFWKDAKAVLVTRGQFLVAGGG